MYPQQPNPYGQPPQQPQYAPQPYGAPPQNPYGVPPQQPQYAPNPYAPQQPQGPYGAHPGMAQQPSLNFGHLDGVDAEGGGGPKLPNGTFWLRYMGARQHVSKKPNMNGKTFFILDFVVVNSLNPQAPVQPGTKYGHSIDQGNALAMGRVVKGMIGQIVGRGANDVPGNWVGTLITKPDAIIDCVVQFDVSDATTDKGQTYKKWAPVASIPDAVVAQFLATVNPTVKQACFPNGLRSERNAPAPITYFEAGAPQVPAGGAYPPQMQAQYGQIQVESPLSGPAQSWPVAPQQPMQQWPPQQPQQFQPQPQPPYGAGPGGPAPMQPPQPMQPGQWPQQQR